MTKEFLFALAALSIMPFTASADSCGTDAANDNVMSWVWHRNNGH